MGGASRAGEAVMDRLGTLQALGVGGTVLGLALAVRAFGAAPVTLGDPREGGVVPEQAPAPARANADSLAIAIARRDPFRLARAPAAVAFNPDPPSSGGAPVQPPRAPRPTLALAGVVLGADPVALIDGLPGVEGSRVMRVGERAGDYVLRAIAADHVVIAGPDTTWTLHVRSQFP
jgi:hypothetical protein